MLTIEEARRIAAERSIPEPNTGCRLWLGGLNRGYPYVWVGSGHKHRRMLRLCRALLGLTDPLIEACHRCDTPLCVNEDHLFPGTQAENVRDMVAKGRHDSFGWKAGLAPTARRKPPTHCKRGHAFDDTNTYHRPNGERACRICRRAETRRYARERGALVAPHLRTHCPQGHPYDAENTYVYPTRAGRPGRHCKTCVRAHKRSFRERHRH